MTRISRLYIFLKNFFLRQKEAESEEWGWERSHSGSEGVRQNEPVSKRDDGGNGEKRAEAVKY